MKIKILVFSQDFITTDLTKFSEYLNDVQKDVFYICLLSGERVDGIIKVIEI